jgi:hypothetical protein
MTDPSPMIPNVDIDEPLSEREQEFASLDGQTGKGGCESCDADYEFSYRGRGVGTLRVRHQLLCPLVLARIRGDFFTDRDTGDEQDDEWDGEWEDYDV